MHNSRSDRVLAGFCPNLGTAALARLASAAAFCVGLAAGAGRT